MDLQVDPQTLAKLSLLDLARTRTIMQGAQYCDFRYKTNPSADSK